MILLDGAYGEGGGQMLRTALALSMLTGQPFRIEGIRQGRPVPGLKAQHLHIVHALRQMSDCRVSDVKVGATELEFTPGRLRGGDYSLDVGTAGAIPLMLQTLIPVCLFAGAPVTWTLRGGTDVPGAMTLTFWQKVLLPYFQPYAGQLSLELSRLGFTPKGGGEVTLRVTPRYRQTEWQVEAAAAPPLDAAQRGDLQGITLISLAAETLAERRVAERQAEACCVRLDHAGVDTTIRYMASHSPGTSLTAVADFTQTRLGADGLGARRKPAEIVGEEVAERLLAELNGPGAVDEHSADNLLLPIAIFGGACRFAYETGHITTNAWVIDHFLPGRLAVQPGYIAAK